jgi:hypothetical protein
MLFLRPLPTLFYTWQFFEVVITLYDPKERPLVGWARNISISLLILGLMSACIFSSVYDGKYTFNTYTLHPNLALDFLDKSKKASNYMEGLDILVSLLSVY